jgi:hypothetical protein
LIIQDAVLLTHCALKIAQQRKGQFQVFREASVTGKTVNADPQNLCIGTFKGGDISLIRRKLLNSPGGKRQHVEC